MGLDMYLDKYYYIGAEFGDVNGNIRVERNGKILPINFMKIDSIKETFGYWRKANQIHDWFVKNVQNGDDDCKDYYVSGDTLLKLRGLCERVLANHHLATDLLPTTSGFFFGDTDYDENYYKQLEYTVDLLKDIKPEDSFIYSSSW